MTLNSKACVVEDRTMNSRSYDGHRIQPYGLSGHHEQGSSSIGLSPRCHKFPGSETHSQTTFEYIQNAAFDFSTEE